MCKSCVVIIQQQWDYYYIKIHYSWDRQFIYPLPTKNLGWQMTEIVLRSFTTLAFSIPSHSPDTSKILISNWFVLLVYYIHPVFCCCFFRETSTGSDFVTNSSELVLPEFLLDLTLRTIFIGFLVKNPFMATSHLVIIRMTSRENRRLWSLCAKHGRKHQLSASRHQFSWPC